MNINKYTEKARESVASAVELAREHNNPQLEPEHLLVALIEQREGIIPELLGKMKADPSAVAQLLTQNGVTRDTILQALTTVRGSQRVTNENPERTYQALERYGRDLTDLARKGKLDPVIGRDEEIRRVIQVLSRRTKNNP